jgi:hypothetical protein
MLGLASSAALLSVQSGQAAAALYGLGSSRPSRLTSRLSDGPADEDANDVRDTMSDGSAVVIESETSTTAGGGPGVDKNVVGMVRNSGVELFFDPSPIPPVRQLPLRFSVQQMHRPIEPHTSTQRWLAHIQTKAEQESREAVPKRHASLVHPQLHRMKPLEFSNPLNSNDPDALDIDDLPVQFRTPLGELAPGLPAFGATMATIASEHLLRLIRVDLEFSCTKPGSAAEQAAAAALKERRVNVLKSSDRRRGLQQVASSSFVQQKVKPLTRSLNTDVLSHTSTAILTPQDSGCVISPREALPLERGLTMRPIVKMGTRPPSREGSSSPTDLATTVAGARVFNLDEFNKARDEAHASTPREPSVASVSLVVPKEDARSKPASEAGSDLSMVEHTESTDEDDEAADHSKAAVDDIAASADTPTAITETAALPADDGAATAAGVGIVVDAPPAKAPAVASQQPQATLMSPNSGAPNMLSATVMLGGGSGDYSFETTDISIAELTADLAWSVVGNTAATNYRFLPHVDIITIDGGAEFGEHATLSGVAFFGSVTHKSMRKARGPPFNLFGGVAGDVSPLFTALTPRDLASPVSNGAPGIHSSGDWQHVLLISGRLGLDFDELNRMPYDEYLQSYKSILEQLFLFLLQWAPTVIIVQGEVHHYLYELILRHDISVIANAGTHAINNASIALGVKAIDGRELSAETRIDRYLGRCRSFKVERVGSAQKDLVILEGTVRRSFTTVVLQVPGYSSNEETRAMAQQWVALMQHAFIAAHHMMNLTHLLADLRAVYMPETVIPVTGPFGGTSGHSASGSGQMFAAAAAGAADSEAQAPYLQSKLMYVQAPTRPGGYTYVTSDPLYSASMVPSAVWPTLADLFNTEVSRTQTVLSRYADTSVVSCRSAMFGGVHHPRRSSIIGTHSRGASMVHAGSMLSPMVQSSSDCPAATCTGVAGVIATDPSVRLRLELDLTLQDSILSAARVAMSVNKEMLLQRLLAASQPSLLPPIRSNGLSPSAPPAPTSPNRSFDGMSPLVARSRRASLIVAEPPSQLLFHSDTEPTSQRSLADGSSSSPTTPVVAVHARQASTGGALTLPSPPSAAVATAPPPALAPAHNLRSDCDLLFARFSHMLTHWRWWQRDMHVVLTDMECISMVESTAVVHAPMSFRAYSTQSDFPLRTLLKRVTERHSYSLLNSQLSNNLLASAAMDGTFALETDTPLVNVYVHGRRRLLVHLKVELCNSPAPDVAVTCRTRCQVCAQSPAGSARPRENTTIDLHQSMSKQSRGHATAASAALATLPTRGLSLDNRVSTHALNTSFASFLEWQFYGDHSTTLTPCGHTLSSKSLVFNLRDRINVLPPAFDTSAGDSKSGGGGGANAGGGAASEPTPIAVIPTGATSGSQWVNATIEFTRTELPEWTVAEPARFLATVERGFYLRLEKEDLRSIINLFGELAVRAHAVNPNAQSTAGGLSVPSPTADQLMSMTSPNKAHSPTDPVAIANADVERLLQTLDTLTTLEACDVFRVTEFYVIIKKHLDMLPKSMQLHKDIAELCYRGKYAVSHEGVIVCLEDPANIIFTALTTEPATGAAAKSRPPLLAGLTSAKVGGGRGDDEPMSAIIPRNDLDELGVPFETQRMFSNDTPLNAGDHGRDPDRSGAASANNEGHAAAAGGGGGDSPAVTMLLPAMSFHRRLSRAALPGSQDSISESAVSYGAHVEDAALLEEPAGPSGMLSATGGLQRARSRVGAAMYDDTKGHTPRQRGDALESGDGCTLTLAGMDAMQQEVQFGADEAAGHDIGMAGLMGLLLNPNPEDESPIDEYHRASASNRASSPDSPSAAGGGAGRWVDSASPLRSASAHGVPSPHFAGHTPTQPRDGAQSTHEDGDFRPEPFVSSGHMPYPTAPQMVSNQSFVCLAHEMFATPAAAVDVLLRPVAKDANHWSVWRMSFESANRTRKRYPLEVTTMFPAQFSALRYLYSNGSPGAFYQSLRRSTPFTAVGGKSKATFFTTLDDQIILKAVKQEELFSFRELWPRYFNLMARHYADLAYPENELKDILSRFGEEFDSPDPHRTSTAACQRTTLCKVFGVFEVPTYESGFFGISAVRKKSYYIVMQKLFDHKKMRQVYDLKGSQRGRLVPSTVGTKMDTNLINDIRRDGAFLYVREDSHARLLATLDSDTRLLENAGVMDYSLVVGIDHNTMTLRVGVIDFLRQFSIDKRVEHLWKRTVGTVAPTVQPPPLYRQRFMKYTTLYFCPLPDQLSSLRRLVKKPREGTKAGRPAESELADAIRRVEATQHANPLLGTTGDV